MEQKLAIGAIVALGIAMRLLAGYLDKGRIEMYAAKQGWNILDRRWSPLGSWWFGGTYSRIYRMVYRDPRGNVHKAYVRTSGSDPPRHRPPTSNPGFRCGMDTPADTPQQRYTADESGSRWSARC